MRALPASSTPCHEAKTMHHTCPASVLHCDFRGYQFCSILIAFIPQRIVVRRDDQGRRYTGEVGGEERGYLWVNAIDSLRQIGVVPLDHLRMGDDISTASEIFPRKPGSRSVEIRIEQHLKTQLRSSLRRLLRDPCGQQPPCAIASHSDPLRVDANFGGVIHDPGERDPGIVVCRGGKGFPGQDGTPQTRQCTGHDSPALEASCHGFLNLPRQNHRHGNKPKPARRLAGERPCAEYTNEPEPLRQDLVCRSLRRLKPARMGTAARQKRSSAGVLQ